MKHIPDDIVNRTILYLEHPSSRLIKREIEDIETVLKPLHQITNIDFSNKSFYYKWKRLYQYKRNRQHLYHRFIADERYHNF